MKISLIQVLTGLVMVFVVGCSGAQDPVGLAIEDLTGIEEVTGGHTRIAWVQDHSGNTDVFAEGHKLLLMGLDSRDGKGEIALLPQPRACKRPVITPDGRHVLFSDLHDDTIHITEWGSGIARQLGSGYAVDAWRDPESGKVWIYALEGPQDRSRNRFARLVRFPLETPGDEREVVWDRTPLSQDNIQLSADGTFTTALLPWPDAFAISLPEQERSRMGRGCWVSTSPDNSYISWVFDGAHRNLALQVAGSGESRQVRINTAPGIEGYEVYHPRWANDVRIMTMTGPYRKGGGGNRIRGGGEDVEVYIGRFDKQWQTIEAWARVTHNERADFYPDVWVANAHTVTVHSVIGAEAGRHLVMRDGLQAAAAPVLPDLKDEWPPSQIGLQFLWQNAMALNEINDPQTDKTIGCRVAARGRAYYHRNHEMQLMGGAFLAEDSNERLLAACRETSELTIQCVFMTRSLDQRGPARIVSFSTDVSSRNFTLGQQDDTLIVRLRTPRTGPNGVNPEVNLFKIEPNRPYHVVVTYRPGELITYLDGAEVARSNAIQGDFSNWSDHQLIFGSEYKGGREWLGNIEHVAIFNRVLHADEVAASHKLIAADLAERKAVERHRVTGKLVSELRHPGQQAMGTYTRALVMGVYEVDKVPGTGQTGEVLVAQWGILDNERLRLPQVGSTRTLVLESWEDHPQLESELLIDDSDRFELPRFYDVGE